MEFKGIRRILEGRFITRYDVDYVDSRSFWLDAKILLMTALQLVRPRGISHAGEATMGEFAPLSGS